MFNYHTILLNFISIFFQISIEEVLTAHKEGRLLVTKNKKLFSSFLFKEWLESSSLKQERDNNDPLIEALWYDFIFINNSENVMRYSKSRHGVNDDTLLHVFYENFKEKEIKMKIEEEYKKGNILVLGFEDTNLLHKLNKDYNSLFGVSFDSKAVQNAYDEGFQNVFEYNITNIKNLFSDNLFDTIILDHTIHKSFYIKSKSRI